MARAILALLSDPHLSRRRPYTMAAWRGLKESLAALGPEAVIVAGDLVLDDCDDADDRLFAADAVAALTPDVLVVPGNHDIGDNVAAPWMDQPATAARLDAFLAVHGRDRFAIDQAGWRIVGLNAQLFGTGLAREAEQWSWLADAVRDAGRRPLALVLHKPLAAPGPAEGEDPNRVDTSACPRLREITADARLKLVISGHYHHYRTCMMDGAVHLWLPSTALVGRRSHGLEPFAQRQPGFVALALDGEEASFALVRTPAAFAVDPVALADSHGEAPRHWPEFQEAITS